MLCACRWARFGHRRPPNLTQTLLMLLNDKYNLHIVETTSQCIKNMKKKNKYLVGPKQCVYRRLGPFQSSPATQTLLMALKGRQPQHFGRVKVVVGHTYRFSSQQLVKKHILKKTYHDLGTCLRHVLSLCPSPSSLSLLLLLSGFSGEWCYGVVMW